MINILNQEKQVEYHIIIYGRNNFLIIKIQNILDQFNATFFSQLVMVDIFLNMLNKIF